MINLLCGVWETQVILLSVGINYLGWLKTYCSAFAFFCVMEKEDMYTAIQWQLLSAVVHRVARML